MNRMNSRNGFGLDDSTVNIDVCIIIIILIIGWLPTIVNAVFRFLKKFSCLCRDKTAEDMRTTLALLWSPYVIGQTIIFSSCSFFLPSSSIYFLFLA